jgi:hypothetical protein
MPLPLTAAAAVGILAVPNINAWVHANLVPSYDPEERSKAYIANFNRPNLIPSIGDLIDIYYRGECTRGELEGILAFQGVDSSSAGGEAGVAKFWRKHLDVAKPRPPLDMIFRRHALGLDLPEPVDDVIRYLGFRDRDYRKVIREDSIPLDVSTLILMFWRNDITGDQLNMYLEHAGYRNADIRRLFKDIRNGPAGVELLSLLNRNAIDVATARKYMKWSLTTGDDEQDLIMSLRHQLPSPTEVALMATRHVFNDAYVAKFKLDSGMPDIYRQLTSQMGFNWTPSDNGPQNPRPGERTMLNYQWAAHWQTLDVGTAVQMLRRLRSTGGMDGGPRVPGVDVFTATDFQDVLTSNEIIPGFREQIGAIAYQVPSRLFVKRLYSAGVIDRKEVVETLKDQGYDDNRSEQLTKLVEYEVLKSHVDKLRPITRQQVVHAYKTGTITRGDAARGLYMLYLDNPNEQLTFSTLPTAVQETEAFGETFVQVTLTSIDAEIKAELVTKAIDVVRKAYLRAEVATLTAIDQLVRLGIVYERANQYVQLWSYELAAEGAEITAGKLVDLYTQGLLSGEEVSARLARLHYSPTDITLLIARANISIGQRQARLLAAQQTAKKREVAGLAATARILKRQQDAIGRQLCKSSTRVQLAKWALSGLITYKEAFERLQECGQTEADAINLLAATAKLEGPNGKTTIENAILGLGPPPKAHVGSPKPRKPAATATP